MIIKRIQKIQEIRDSFSTLKVTSSAKYNKNDVRVTAFSKIINVLNSALLGSSFINQCLLNNTWWEKTAKESISIADRKIYANEYDMFLKLGLLQFIFSSVESSFRLLLKTLDPNACSKGTADFKNIYDHLFNKLKLSKKYDFPVLLDLLRLIRNSLHNNGVYFHKSNKNYKLSYKGEEYSFVIGNAIDFGTWDLLLELIQDIEVLVNKIMSNTTVTSIDEIIDPFAK